MSIGEVSHGAPSIAINKSHLNSLNINITTHLVQQMGRNTVNCLKFDRNVWECVCMCATALLKAKTFKAFAIYFSVYLGYGSNSGENVIFCSKLLVSVLL